MKGDAARAPTLSQAAGLDPLSAPFIQGEIVDPHLLADLFSFLHATQRTAVLTVAEHALRKSVFFNAGGVIAAKSNQPDDGFGRIALRLGLVDQGQIIAALQSAGPQTKIGNALLNAGAINPGELWRILTTQIQEICCSLFLLDSGQFTISHYSETQPATSTPLDTQFLLLEGMRRRDELDRKRARGRREVTARYKSVEAMLKTYNDAYARVFTALADVDHSIGDSVGIRSLFTDPESPTGQLFKGVVQDEDGQLLLAPLQRSIANGDATTATLIRTALRDYLRFLLFMAREVLPPTEGEALAVNIRSLISSS